MTSSTTIQAASTTLVTKTDSSMLSPRVVELRKRRNSLRDNIPMNRTSSSLSMASLNSDARSAELAEGDPEKLSRSLSRIRIRRPSMQFNSSAQFNVDLNGILDTPEDETKSTTTLTSEKSREGQSAPSGMIGKAYSKIFLANYPDQERSAFSKVYNKTILANYPVPGSKAPSDMENTTQRTLSFSDGASDRSN
ncbi:MAG: hypothetical protein SGBAC_013511 [Bacillariaceae sp.]